MTSKVKIIILSLWGVIVHFTLYSVFSLFINEPLYVKLITRILVLVLGSLYLHTLETEKNNTLVSKKFYLMAGLTVLVFVFASFVTSQYLLSNCFEDIAFEAQNEAKLMQSDSLQMLSLGISIFLSPVCEELMYRGFMYGQLSKFNKVVAAIISSLVFALSHGTIIHLYTAFIGGLIFCYIYDKTSKLRYSIAAHMLFNLLTIGLSCFNISSYASLHLAIVSNVLLLTSIVCLYITGSGLNKKQEGENV